MPVKKTEPEVAVEAKRALDARAPARAERDRKIAEESARWEKEIAALETRVHTEFAEVDLGNGSVIAIRLCLLASEIERVEFLEKAIKVETNDLERALLASELIEIITANPYITKEWLMANRDKYSPNDVAIILLGYMEVKLEERKAHFTRLQSAMDFRAKPGGE